MNVFGQYSNYYDSLYKDKNYKLECVILKDIFKKYSPRPVKTILDLGCGTGNHSFILHKMGYSVTGIDRSSAMLNIAIQKLKALKIKSDLSFQKADVRFLDLKKKLDVAIMMFAVLGYQLENKDIVNTLISVRKHLKKGSLFIFDSWFGPAVLHTGPSDKVKKVKIITGEIRRFTHTDKDVLNQRCVVHFKTQNFRKGKITNTVTEDHPMRYFFS